MTTTDRTLPVTPAERFLVTVLRAYLAWNTDEANDPEGATAWCSMVKLGEYLVTRCLVEPTGRDLTPAGRDLLARVEAAERTAWDALPTTERAGYLAYLADDARDVRNDKTDFGPRWIRILRAVSDALARPDAPSAFAPPKRGAR